MKGQKPNRLDQQATSGHQPRSMQRILPLLRSVLTVAGYLVVFAALDRTAIAFGKSVGVSAWYPPPGLSLAMLLIFGLSCAPALLVGILISGLWIWRLNIHLCVLLILALLITLDYSLAAAILRHALQIDLQLRRLRDVSWFVLTALIVPVIAATLSVADFAANGLILWSDYPSAVLNFWVGDAIGIVTLTPFLLVHGVRWARALMERATTRGAPAREVTSVRRRRPTGRAVLEVLAPAGSIALVLWVVFGSRITDPFHLHYICFLPLIWIALQHGLPGATAGILAINVGAMLAIQVFGFELNRLADLQILMLALSLTGLFLGVVVTERKRAEEALEQRATQLALLNDIGGKIAAMLELDSVMDRIVHLVQESFGYHHVALFTMERERGELVMRAGAGAFTALFPPDHQLELDQGMVGWVGCHGKRLLANDVSVEPRYVNFFPDAISTQSELSVPIQISEETVGVLDIQSPQLNAFNENDVMMMETLADQIAVAIGNARLYEAVRRELAERKRAEEALRRYADEQAALYAVTSAVATSLDPGELLSTVLDVTLSVMGSHAGWVLSPGPTLDDPPRVVAWRGVPESLVAAEMATPLRTCPVCAPLLADGDAQSEPQLVVGCPRLPPRVLASANLHSHVCIPLSAGDKVLGILDVAWCASRPCTEPDRALLMAIGRQVGLALHNAQLYQTGLQMDRLRVLNELDQALAATLDPETVAEVTLRQVAAALDAPTGALFLLPPQANDSKRAFTLEQGWTDTAVSEKKAQRLQTFLQWSQDGREAISLSSNDLTAIGGDLDLAQRWGPNGLVVPIRGNGRLVAVLVLGSQPADRPFTDQDRSLAQAAASHAGQVIRNTQLYQETVRRLKEAETLSTVTTALTCSLDLDQVLQSIVDSATRLIPASTSGVIHLADEAAGNLIPRATSPSDIKIRETMGMPIGKGIAGLVMQEKQLINVHNVEQDPRFLPFDSGTLKKSLLTAPLMIDGDCIGTLSLNSDKVGAFSADDERLLTTLAAQATIAVRNARLFEQAQQEIAERKRVEEVLQQQLEELVILHAVATTGAEATGEDKLIERAIQIVDRVLDADRFGVLLLDEAAGLLRLHPSLQPPHGTKEMTIPLGHGVAGRVAADGQPRHVPDVTCEPEYPQPDPPICSQLCVPLKAGGRIIGVINAESTRPDAFSEADERLLTTFAGQLVIAMEKVRLMKMLQRRVDDRTRELSALYDVTAMVNVPLGLKAMLGQVLERVLVAMRSNAGAIHLLDEAGETLCLAAQQGIPPDVVAQIGAIPVGSGLVGWVIEHSKPLAVPDIGTDPRASRIARIGNRWAYVGVPVQVREQPLGAISVLGETEERFSLEEMALLASIADHVGVVVENAWLRQQAERAAVMGERERLARELHDSVTQSLYGMSLLAETGQRSAKGGDLERVAHYLARLGETAQQALKEMRLLVYELRPSALQREGLVGALQQRLDAVEKRVGVETCLLVEGAIELPVHTEEGLYRIAQEALNNALKHAAATSVRVYIRASGGRVELEVVDDGKGFDPDAARDEGGMGLGSMRERAERAGGVLTLLSAPGEGTRVKVSMEAHRNSEDRVR